MKTADDYLNLDPAQLSELERAAYASGDTERAALLEALAVERGRVDDMEDLETLAQWEKENGPASEYRDFFTLCFDNLGAHYPCASITSERDQGVIFQAIRLGEESRDLLQRIAADGGNFADEARALLNGDY